MGMQLLWLVILAIPIACISWTVTHEEVLREPREYALQRSRNARTIWERKFFYLFTCEYCFSHYVAALFLGITGYKLLYQDWRGYLVSFFALVWMANIYMGIFGQVKLGVSKGRMEIKSIEKDVEIKDKAA
jgi:hypothetical protein